MCVSHILLFLHGYAIFLVLFKLYIENRKFQIWVYGFVTDGVMHKH